MKALVFAVFGPIFFMISVAQAGQVSVWTTSADGKTQFQAGQDFEDSPTQAAQPGDSLVTLNLSDRRQSITGFGGAMTDASAGLLEALPAALRDQTYQDLFGAQGAHLSMIRVPIGANDFSYGNYSCDDLPDGVTSDPDMQYFSIEKCTSVFLPALKRVLSINPQVQFVASPWSAPGWMKTSGSMVGGVLAQANYQAYAKYLVRFALEMKRMGVPIQYFTIVNEPLYTTNTRYPGLGLTAAEQADFIKNFLGPEMLAEGVLGTLKILVYDHNWDTPSYPIDVMSDPAVNLYVAGTALHCYGGTVSQMTDIYNVFPDKELHLTECSGGTWTGGDFTESLTERYNDLIYENLRRGAKSSVFWNIALDPFGGPRNNGCYGCVGLVTIDLTSNQVERTYDYDLLAQASKAAAPGAVRVGSTTEDADLLEVAFQNPDGSLGVVLRNVGVGAKALTVLSPMENGSKSFRFSVAAGDLATFVWRP